MSEKPISDDLERALHAPEPYLDNQGFSQQVVHALPRHQRFPLMRRQGILATCALLGGLCSLPSLHLLYRVPLLQTAITSQWFPTVAIMLCLGAVAYGTWRWATVSSYRRYE